jgi:hypothetical protein
MQSRVLNILEAKPLECGSEAAAFNLNKKE